jgi:hypothetical protein
MVVTSEGFFYQYNIDLENGGECVLLKQYRFVIGITSKNHQESKSFFLVYWSQQMIILEWISKINESITYLINIISYLLIPDNSSFVYIPLQIK